MKKVFKFLVPVVAALVSCAAMAQTVVPQTGYWWNPSDPGTGYVIEIQGNTMLLAAFTYDSGGNATWVTSTGPMTSPTQYSGQLTTYYGGQTLTGPYQPATQGASAGNISIEFSADWSALVTLGSVIHPIQRYQFANNGLNSPPLPGEPQTGWWWDSSQSGRGYALEIQNGLIYFAGYTYTAAGNPVWYLANGDVTNSNSYVGFWSQYAGGQTLGGAYKAPVLANADVGSATLQFVDACDMTLTLPNGQQIPLTRFSFASPAADLGCTVFPIDLAMANLTVSGFQASESFSGNYEGVHVSGTGTETASPPFESGFGNQPALSVATATIDNLVLGTATESQSSMYWQYFSYSYQPLGDLDDSGAYYVQTSFPGWPTAARIGDQGQLGSVTIYSNQNMAAVIGTQQLSFSVDDDTSDIPGTAIFTLVTSETDVNGGETSVGYDRFRVTESGTLTYLSSELSAPGSDLIATVTAFRTLAPSSATAAMTSMTMTSGASQRRAPAVVPAHMLHMKRLFHAMQSRAPQPGH